MAGFSIVTDQPQPTGASRPHPMMPEPVDKETSRSISNRDSQTNSILRGSQTCTKRLLLGRPMSASHNPPLNFSIVSDGLYRSGYPQTQDYPFLQSLKLKTIVTLVNKELPDGYRELIQINQITHKIFDMAGTKEEIPIEMMRSIHAVVSNSENYPLLVHCNHGKHRTGCVVGVLRKSNQWGVQRILEEYSTFAEPKVRETDLKYLAEFEPASLWYQPHEAAPPSTTNRFFRFIIVVILALFAFYPLSKFKGHEPRPEPN